MIDCEADLLIAKAESLSLRLLLGGAALQRCDHRSLGPAEVTNGTFLQPLPGLTLFIMSNSNSYSSSGTSHNKFRCAQCEMPEGSCECDKFCCLCQTTTDVRICEDGLMYCEPCRSACDYKT